MPGTVLGAEEAVEKTDEISVFMGLLPRVTDKPHLLMTGNDCCRGLREKHRELWVSQTGQTCLAQRSHRGLPGGSGF